MKLNFFPAINVEIWGDYIIMHVHQTIIFHTNTPRTERRKIKYVY